MNKISGLKYFFLTRFSKPRCNRKIYRSIKKNKVSSILEIGVGNGDRAETLIGLANQFCGCGSVRYTGIDVFEAGEKAEITLKSFHQRLNSIAAKIQLVPGEMYPSLHRIANSHTRTDIMIISAGYDAASLDDSWFYLPRMLHATSLVFLQPADDTEAEFEILTRLEIERKVKQQSTAPQRRAA